AGGRVSVAPRAECQARLHRHTHVGSVRPALFGAAARQSTLFYAAASSRQHPFGDPSMSSLLYSQLQWLPAVPATFSAECKQLAQGGEALGKRAQWLAGHALDDVGL